MYDGLWSLFSVVTLGAAPSSGGVSNTDVKVAIVTTIGVVVAAGLTALATTFQRSRNASPDSFTRQYVENLQQDHGKLEEIRVKYSKLRDAVWEKGFDPDVLIREQTDD